MAKENDMQQCEAILASEIFSQSLLGQVNHHDVDCMIEAQKHMLQRYEKTNEMLINCNALSATRLSTATHDFKRHTLLLLDMKKDLEIVFKRIKNLKSRLGMQYPQAFESCKDECSMAEEDADMEFGIQESETSGETVAKTNIVVNLDKPTSKIVANLVTNSSSCSQTTTPSSEASNTSSDST